MKPYPFSLDRLPPRRLSGPDGRASLIVTCPELSSICSSSRWWRSCSFLAWWWGHERVCRRPLEAFRKRYGDRSRRLRGEGLRLLLPWNQLFLYDLRLQSMTETYNAISSDGVSLTATMNVRFRLQRNAVPVLHQAVGPDYLNLLVKPGIGSLTREVIAEYTAEQVYSTARQEIQDKIRGLAESRLSEKMMEREGGKSYRISLTDTVILFDTLVQGIELPQVVVGAINRKTEQYYISEEYKFRVAARNGSLSARRSRQKACETSSRSSVKASRIPICVGAVLRRRFNFRNPTIRRS